jgi:hypothetical protein
MLDPAELLDDFLAPDSRTWLREACGRLRTGAAELPVLFPQLPRRIGRDYLPPELRRDEDSGAVVDFGAWRACDAAALRLLAAAERDPRPKMLLDLHDRGDMEERTMALRALACLPIGAATGRLLGDAQRTNHVNHVVAACLDSNLLARTLDAADPRSTGFGREEFNRMILKLAFLDLPLRRVFGARRHADPELSGMLQGLATEREAAGRKVWHDTNRLIAHAPTAGTIARVVGGLEHGDDEHRLAAAEGVATLRQPWIRDLIAERLSREPRASIRAALERALETTN